MCRHDLFWSLEVRLRSIGVALKPRRAIAGRLDWCVVFPAEGQMSHSSGELEGAVMQSFRFPSLLIATAAISLSPPVLAQPASELLGKVHFETSCAPDAATAF